NSRRVVSAALRSSLPRRSKIVVLDPQPNKCSTVSVTMIGWGAVTLSHATLNGADGRAARARVSNPKALTCMVSLMPVEDSPSKMVNVAVVEVEFGLNTVNRDCQ